MHTALLILIIAASGGDTVRSSTTTPGVTEADSSARAIIQLIEGLDLDTPSPEWIRDRWGFPQLRFIIDRPFKEVVEQIHTIGLKGQRLPTGWRLMSYTKSHDERVWLFPAIAPDGGGHTLRVSPHVHRTEILVPTMGTFTSRPGRGRLIYCPHETILGPVGEEPESLI